MKKFITILVMLLTLQGFGQYSKGYQKIINQSFLMKDNDKELTGLIGVATLATAFVLGEFVIKKDNAIPYIGASATILCVSIKITEKGRSKRTRKFIKRII